MAQGAGARRPAAAAAPSSRKAKASKAKARTGMKVKGGKLAPKKGAYARAPKKAQAVKAKKDAEQITKAINARGITVAAAKALQNKETITLGDVRGSGKEYAKTKAQLRNMTQKAKREKARHAAAALAEAQAAEEA
jgi:hypothetical protein